MKSTNQNSWFFTILHQISAFFCILLLIRPAFLLANQSSFGDLISLLPDFAFVMFMKICHQPQAHSRGRGRGARAPPEMFRFELNSAIEVEFCLLQWRLQFPSIVDHSKIMYCCSSVQFGIV